MGEIENTERFIAIIIGAFTGLGAWLQWFLPWLQAFRRKKKFVDNLDGFQAIYSTMERAEDCGATRTIIFGAHNSGGIPRPGSPFYVTAFHYNVPPEKAKHVYEYKGIHVDSVYITMLLNSMRLGFVRFDWEQPDCLLKRIYTAEGVQDSIISFLCIRDNTFFFISFCSYARKFTDIEITELQLKSSLIANEIKKM